MAWREVETEARRRLPEQMNAWRKNVEPRLDLQTEAQQFAFVDGLVAAGEERIVVALAGVQSATPSIADQRRVLDDVLTIPGWPGSGRTDLVHAPRTLVFVFQQLHGALCCDIGRPDAALKLATTPVRNAQSDGPGPLWKQPSFTNYPTTLRDCTLSWKYLRSLPDRAAFLFAFFATKRDYETALAVYSALLSLLEFAHDAPSLQTGSPAELARGIMHDTAPMFATMDKDTVEVVCRRVFADRDVVNLVQAQSPSTHAQLEAAWPVWKKVLARMRSQVRAGYPVDDALFGPLA